MLRHAIARPTAAVFAAAALVAAAAWGTLALYERPSALRLLATSVAAAAAVATKQTALVLLPLLPLLLVPALRMSRDRRVTRRFALAALAQAFTRRGGPLLGARFEAGQEFLDVASGGGEQPYADGLRQLTLAAGRQRLVEQVERARLGFAGVGFERALALRGLDPARGDRHHLFVQPLGAAAVERQPAEQDDAGHGITALGEAGAGEVVMHETLGAEAREQALRDALFEVQVNGIVGEHPRVFEDDGADGRFTPPLGELLVRRARRAQRVQRRGPARVGLGAAVQRREDVDAAALVVHRFGQRLGAENFERAGQRGLERRGIEAGRGTRAFEQAAAALDLCFEFLAPLAR